MLAFPHTNIYFGIQAHTVLFNRGLLPVHFLCCLLYSTLQPCTLIVSPHLCRLQLLLL